MPPGCLPTLVPNLSLTVVLQLKESTHCTRLSPSVCSGPHFTDPWPPISPRVSLLCFYSTLLYSCCLCSQTVLLPSYNTLLTPTAHAAGLRWSPAHLHDHIPCLTPFYPACCSPTQSLPRESCLPGSPSQPGMFFSSPHSILVSPGLLPTLVPPF